MGFVSNASKQNKVNLSYLRSRRKGNKFGNKHECSSEGHLPVHKELSHLARNRVEMEEDKIFKRDLVLILCVLMVCMGLLWLILKDI